MVHNKACPYCSCRLTKENRSREHLIPKVAYLNGKGIESDFYACKECNNRKKGYLDTIIGLYSKLSSGDDEIVGKAFEKALDAKDYSKKRAVNTIISAERYGVESVQMTIDIRGREVIDYGEMLAKGCYFLENNEILSTRTSVIEVDFVAGKVLDLFAASYASAHGTKPFEDLKQNKCATYKNDDDIVVWSKNKSYMISFYSRMAFMLRVHMNTFSNRKRVKDIRERLLRMFQK